MFIFWLTYRMKLTKAKVAFSIKLDASLPAAALTPETNSILTPFLY
jgi:hypothetical protein